MSIPEAAKRNAEGGAEFEVEAALFDPPKREYNRLVSEDE
jgi:hypothetical protein